MILAIDMGNSNIVVGGIDSDRVYFEERLTTDRSRTNLEYAIYIKNILEIHGIDFSRIEGPSSRPWFLPSTTPSPPPSRRSPARRPCWWAPA